MTADESAGTMTIDEMIGHARTVVEQDVGRDFWLDLAKNKSHDYESCYLCGGDLEWMGGADLHESWCPTFIARRVLGLNTRRNPVKAEQKTVDLSNTLREAPRKRRNPRLR